MLRPAVRRTRDLASGLVAAAQGAGLRSQAHTCTRSQAVSNLVVRCTPVVPGRFSAVRSFSTEPVLQNAANPEKPAAPLERPAAASADGNVVVSEKVQRLCDDILALNMLEINQLLKVLKSALGLTDADLRGAAVAAGPGAGAAPAAAEEKAPEKLAFDLKLVGFDEKSKIKVIKEVRVISGLGLKEAKELVEGAPKVIKKGLKKDEAEKLKKVLEDVGAKVELD